MVWLNPRTDRTLRHLMYTDVWNSMASLHSTSGHMGLKVGKAMGLNVTVISHSPKKKAKALAMGADNFVVSSEKEEMAAAAKSCKLIIDTVSADHQAKDFLPLLENDGTLCIVGTYGRSTYVNSRTLTGSTDSHHKGGRQTPLVPPRGCTLLYGIYADVRHYDDA